MSNKDENSQILIYKFLDNVDNRSPRQNINFIVNYIYFILAIE